MRNYPQLFVLMAICLNTNLHAADAGMDATIGAGAAASAAPAVAGVTFDAYLAHIRDPKNISYLERSRASGYQESTRVAAAEELAYIGSPDDTLRAYFDRTMEFVDPDSLPYYLQTSDSLMRKVHHFATAISCISPDVRADALAMLKACQDEHKLPFTHMHCYAQALRGASSNADFMLNLATAIALTDHTGAEHPGLLHAEQQIAGTFQTIVSLGHTRPGQIVISDPTAHIE